MSNSKVVLSFKDEETLNGNAVKTANIKGTLKRLSEKVFEYANGSGETIRYKLATIAFKDLKDTTHVRENVVVYESSYEQGMEVGTTYLGRITRSKNADGTARKPWVTLYSAVAGEDFSDDDFAELPVEAEMSIQ